ncbi:hypothetical protein [Sphingomicrobium flavum]|uniref:hypothetical protein n=1 Tax=Sphingomicrobium flavum TaxID=1229164 RepID=UPI0021AE1DE3|nr:hypothetical protein [Sphingomicrobium flavum]
MKRLLASVALFGAAGALSGCIAAAIPIVAGGAMAGSEVLEKDEVEEAGSPPPAQAPVAPAISTTRVVAQVAAEEDETDGASGEAEVQNVNVTANIPPPPPTAAPGADFGPYEALVKFVASHGPAGDRQQAMLSDPASLRPDRDPCASNAPAAVIIDLDAAEGGAGQAQNQLALAARQIRAMGASIVWISGRPEGDLVPLRTRLVQSGLDGDAQDSILMLPEGIRKQELRQATGEQFCVLAIAGDTRADFDELYDYIRDRDRALALEALIGAGWFLVPAPLSEEEIANALGS